MSRERLAASSVPGGFAAIPRRTLDLLLCLPLTRRELSVLLLVARLTYGCRNAAWARLLQADLSAVGIGANHAHAVLEDLMSRHYLERRSGMPEYRLGNLEAGFNAVASGRAGRLEALVAVQLTGMPRNRKLQGMAVPDTGRLAVPKREVPSSQNGNASTVLVWRFDRSQRRFLSENKATIDKEIQ